MKIRTPLAIAGAVVALSVPLAACSSSNDHSGMSEMNGSASPTIPVGAQFNSTDVGFAQGMIPHHAQAVEMADMALVNTTNPDVLALARQIKAAQSPEIEKMTGWLKSWGQNVPSTAMGSMAGHDMTGMDGMMMDGMMSEADMKRLSTSSGTAFDRLWLELMIQHHEGAVKMAKVEVADGKYPDVIALAQAIISGQQAEITTMESLIKNLPA
jgi:uncharacterized protein (DUF305 family)